MADDLNNDPTVGMNQPPPPPMAPTQAPLQASDGTPVGFEDMTTPQPNFAVGLAAAIGLGLAAVALYAVVAIFSGREFAILAVLIGVGVAFGFTRFGRTSGILAGIVAGVVALVLFFVAIFVTMAGMLSKEADYPFFTALGDLMSQAGLAMEIYFEDPLSYVFVAISVVIAFAYASGLAGKKVGREKA